MANVVIFGVRDTASLAHVYLRHDSEHDVVGFCVTREHMPQPAQFEGLPVVAVEDLEQHYSPDEYSLFAPMTGREMNRLRQGVYLQAKERGYSLISYVSSLATVLPNTAIGENCFILENNTIQPFVTIGNNVVLWSGNHIGHHSVINDHAFFTSQVVLSGHCTVGSNSFFGVNSAIKDDTKIAEGTFVSMGAIVTKDTEPWSVYRGNPARKLKITSHKLGA